MKFRKRLWVGVATKMKVGSVLGCYWWKKKKKTGGNSGIMDAHKQWNEWNMVVFVDGCIC